MKKSNFFIAIVLIIEIGFTACSPKVAEISQETLFFVNTEWGMTKAETMKALKINEKELVRVEQDRDSIDVYVIKDYDYKGSKCDLFIYFTNDKFKGTAADAFYSAVIKSKDKAFVEDEQSIYSEKLSDCKIKTGGANGDGIMVTYINPNTQKDYIIKNNIDVENFLVETSKEGLTQFDPNSYSKEEMLDLLDNNNPSFPDINALSTLSIQLDFTPDKDGYIGTIEFDGANYAHVAAYNR